MVGFFRHYLLPHHSNNHRPKVLHHSSLFALILFLFVFLGITSFVKQEYPAVLGVSANMSVDELVTITNQVRQEKGLEPLRLNTRLSQAAALKAHDMFGKNYWAHNAPDGATPWGFIKTAGYEYLYAGENLARGYTTAPDVVKAWMASPSHKENILSPNYTEIGFAINTGTLTGSDTVLVVEMFGKPYLSQDENTSEVAAAIVPSVEPMSSPTLSPQGETTANETPEVNEQPVESPAVAAVQNQPLVDSNTVKRNIAFVVIGFLLAVFIIDAIMIERKKITRVVSHNVDHIVFLTILLILAIILGKGSVL